jgi:hypothetical protein
MAVWRRRPEILLCHNIPKPLHGVAPRAVLGNRWWNATRKAAYASTNYRCVACTVHKTRAKYRKWMEAHEVYDIDYETGRSVFVEAVPLCNFCHNYIHDGRLNALLAAGQIPHGKYQAIVAHGDAVLAEYGLVRESYEQRDSRFVRGILEGTYASWGEWRMVVNNVEYPPRFLSYEEWLRNAQKTSDE